VESFDEYKLRAQRERVRVTRSGRPPVIFERNLRNWRDREPWHPWRVISFQSAKSRRTGERLAAHGDGVDRTAAWQYSEFVEKVIRDGEVIAVGWGGDNDGPDARYVYDFTNEHSISGEKLWPVLDLLVSQNPPITKISVEFLRDAVERHAAHSKGFAE
jgi:hypothetical protein